MPQYAGKVFSLNNYDIENWPKHLGGGSGMYGLIYHPQRPMEASGDQR